MQQQPTLLILAAGMGSRYGGLKQIDGIGPNGEAIIEYSIYDAIQSGFGKVVFVIRREFETAFKDVFEPKLAGKIETAYAFQAIETQVGDISIPERTKPWGTAHAVLAAQHLINEPFAVINADDFYGRAAYQTCADFLNYECAADKHCMIGYVLENTLSEHGSVSRGVCAVENGHLTGVVEHTKIYEKGEVILANHEGRIKELPASTYVSMNYWGFHPAIFDTLRKGFPAFVKDNHHIPKSEYFIPLVVEGLLDRGEASVAVLECAAKWFGVTYKADKEAAEKAIAHLIERGDYPSNLWI